MAAFSIMQSYLAVALNATDTSLSVINGYSYPNSGTLVIDSEQITYTSISGNTLLGCTRGANGTTAASHTIYTSVAMLQSNQIIDHEIGVDDAMTNVPVPISGYIQSSDVDIDDGHNYSFIWRMLPDLTFTGSTDGVNPVVYMTVRPKELGSGSTYKVAPSPSVTGASTSTESSAYTPIIYTRVRGRQVAFRIESFGLGVMWQLGAMRFDIRPDGRR
jgi:hypothetical protein